MKERPTIKVVKLHYSYGKWGERNFHGRPMLMSTLRKHAAIGWVREEPNS